MGLSRREFLRFIAGAAVIGAGLPALPVPSERPAPAPGLAANSAAQDDHNEDDHNEKFRALLREHLEAGPFHDLVRPNFGVWVAREPAASMTSRPLVNASALIV
jgi:hypothetical protein